MALKLMYITNKPEVAQIAQEAGVDCIFIDMEYIGKADRQGGMDTVQSHHTVEDIIRLRPFITSSELLVRVNPIHDQGSYRGTIHSSSEEEINAVIEAGADIVMLPYFKTIDEIITFLNIVDGRIKTSLLLETVESVNLIDDILQLDGIDEIHIGLNDLSLEQGKNFMFQLLADGTVENLCHIISTYGIPYGFGGIASPGHGMIPAEYIIRDHHYYGSQYVILSRSFCNTDMITDIDEIRTIFQTGVKEIRHTEKECSRYTQQDFVNNHEKLKRIVQAMVEKMS